MKTKKQQEADGKNFIIGLVILIATLFIVAITDNCHAQETAYLVTVDRFDMKQKTADYIITADDSLHNLTQKHFGSAVDICLLMQNNNVTLLTTYNTDFYCERKRVKKIRRNGKMVLRRIKQIN